MGHGIYSVTDVLRPDIGGSRDGGNDNDSVSGVGVNGRSGGGYSSKGNGSATGPNTGNGDEIRKSGNAESGGGGGK